MGSYKSITELYLAVLEGKEDPEQFRNIMRSILYKRFRRTLNEYPTLKKDLLQEIELAIQIYLNKKPDQIKAKGFDVVRAIARDATRGIKRVLLLSAPLTFPEDAVEKVFFEARGGMEIVNLTLRSRSKGKKQIVVNQSGLEPPNEGEDETSSGKEEIEEPAGHDRVKERYLTRIIAAMTTLTKEEREIVELKHFSPEGEELTFTRIAELLKLPPTKVSTLYRSAIEKIKHKVTDKDIR